MPAGRVVLVNMLTNHLPYHKTLSHARPLLAFALALAIMAAPCATAGAHAAQREQTLKAGDNNPAPVVIEYIPTGSPHSVNVAGVFNGWSTSATPMARKPNSLAWTVTLQLTPGIYEYKIVVNGTRWIAPPDAPHLDDGNGNINALLTVAPPDFAETPSGREARFTPSAVFHTAARVRPATTAHGIVYLSRRDNSRLNITLRTRRGEVSASRLIADSPAVNASWPMKRIESDSLFDFWVGTLPIVKGQRAARYAFQFNAGNSSYRYDGSLTRGAAGRASHWFEASLADFPSFETPDWARDAIFYQIFPDRFADGDPTNNPPDAIPWSSDVSSDRWMGGDLQGVLQHFEHLRGLGINALYFNPIFAARSNHAYDTTDYKRVDPRFGTNDTLKAITKRAHLHGWHVILDGVFNHTGVDFGAFQNILTEGRNSPYKSWYFIHHYPVEVKDGQKSYEGWYGIPWMPKLNVQNPPTRDYLLNVTTGWIRDAQIDGWRLDAANEINPDFLKALRKSVKREKADALIVAEIWGDASDWLQGDQADSVMNYRWRGAALDFFVWDKTSPSRFDALLTRIRDDYPAAATAVMFNMLGSHDVERLRTLCKGDRNRERMAVAFQMTYPGAPCIYYGDEIGMEGGKDPDDRRGMNWSEQQWDRATFAFYKSMIAMRKQHVALRRGDFKTLLSDDATGLYGYLRSSDSERAVVLFNRSDGEQTLTLPATARPTTRTRFWYDSGAKLTTNGIRLMVTLPARGFAVIGL